MRFPTPQLQAQLGPGVHVYLNKSMINLHELNHVKFMFKLKRMNFMIYGKASPKCPISRFLPIS